MNSFGRIFRVSIFGESHGELVGVVIDGFPHGIDISEYDFAKDLSRRQAGAKGTSPRVEKDAILIKSGVFKGKSTGAPILLFTENMQANSAEYDDFKLKPRPGHSDFTAHKKYLGYNDYRGGGHFSGRLTWGIVAAGVLAKKILADVTISSQVIRVNGSEEVQSEIDKAVHAEDSVGAIVECKVNGLPIGYGEPYFDSVESMISHIAFSIPAIKGIEFGSGFKAATMMGSEHNDSLIDAATGKTLTNHAGGVNGGISNGNELDFRVAVKPASSIAQKQKTIDLDTGEQTEISIKGRHDACIALRVPPVLEAATAIALADLKLLASASSS